MLSYKGAWRSLSYALGFILFVTTNTYAQEQRSLINSYFDPVQGASANDFVRRALAANGELAAARLEIERARARVRQAGLRPNPTIDAEHSTGRFTGSTGESEVSVGVAVPIELGGKRRRRVELARAELEASEAEVADRERRLTNEIRSLYAEALAAIRELSTLEELNDLDLQTTRFVQARVNEGETAPIELNQLRVEVERMRSRRALVEGRLKSTLLRLKSLIGVGPSEILRLREDLRQPLQTPASVDAAVEIALRSRPDLRFARLSEEVAQAGLQLARAQAVPDLTPFTKYSNSRSIFEDTPVGVLRDRDKLLTFGVSIELPIFNRNQGGKAESALAIDQARRRREFLEAMIRSEVQSAFARYDAAQAAVTTFEQGAIRRSSENVRTIRAAYQIGAFSITDLLVEQRRLLDVQREFTEALAERYRALADLQAAMGLPAGQQ
ncbi:MAG TPA: TolC family protein [Pyrinomonadaceae bacterium]|nr:TolC family protein [Pyrinomonadaceae bacterium]